MARELGVWMAGDRLGTVAATRSGALRFSYDQRVIDEWPGNTPLVSCSLPVSSRALPADAFFEGLLPEGVHRSQLAQRADVRASDTLGLLDAYGRDIAGALVVSAVDVGPRPGSVEPLDAAALRTEVAGLGDRPLGVHHDSELSIPGLQDKMLLVDRGAGDWGRPVHGYPSTHILKLDHRVHRGLVAAEHACLQIARAAGLDAAEAELVEIGGMSCLIVARFDRRVGVDEGGERQVARLHQEDACQALGLPPTTKYEIRHGGGGPELSQVADLLDRFAEDPMAEQDRLLDATTFTVLIGNADAHGKNLSLLLDPPGSVRLAPLYDTVPTKMWPQLVDGAAMTVGGMVNLAAMTPQTVAAEAGLWRRPKAGAQQRAVAVAERVRGVVADGRAVDAESPLGRLLLTRCVAFLDAGTNERG